MMLEFNQCLHDLDIVTLLFLYLARTFTNYRNIRAHGNIYHIFKPNTFRDVKDFYQDKRNIDMTPIKLKFLTPTCWVKKINISLWI